MIRNAFLIVTFIVLIFYQSACTGKPGAFEELSCQPPCWQGLTPGETTKSELIVYLNNSPIIEKDSFVEKEGYEIFQSEIAFNLTSGTRGEAYFLDDILSVLYFFDDVDINFNDAIELFGEPKFLLVYTDWCNPSPRFSFGDAECQTIHAINPKIGVEYGYQTKISDHIEITPNSQLISIGFFDPDKYNELVEGRAFYGFTSEKFLKYTRPWTGYGELPEQ